MTRLLLTARLTLLVAGMKAGGSRVRLRSVPRARRALEAARPATRKETYLVLRGVLCRSEADWQTLEAAFDVVFWRPPRRVRASARDDSGFALRGSRR